MSVCVDKTLIQVTSEMTETHASINEQIYCKQPENWCENYVELWCEETVPEVVLECLALNNKTLTSMTDENFAVESSDFQNKLVINSMPLQVEAVVADDKIAVNDNQTGEKESMIDSTTTEILNYKSIKERTESLINSVTCEAAEREVLKLRKEILISSAITESSEYKSVEERKKSIINLLNSETTDDPKALASDKHVLTCETNETAVNKVGTKKEFLIDSLNSDLIDFEEFDRKDSDDSEEEICEHCHVKETLIDTFNHDTIGSENIAPVVAEPTKILKKIDTCGSLNSRRDFLMCMISELMDSNKLREEECRMSKFTVKYNDRYEGKQSDDRSSKTLPDLLTVSQMMSLGSVISKKSTVIKLEKFFVNEMVWSSQQEKVEFIIDKTPLGKGTYREAFRATCLNEKVLQMKKHWVVKRLLKRDNHKNALTPDQEARQTVQMHMLAKHFTDLVKNFLMQERRLHRFGSLFCYNEIYYGINESGEVVTVEEFVEGNFEKYINNNGEVLGDPDNEISLKAVAYMHFSFEKSQRQLLLTDLQGVQYNLVDPEISSLKLRDEKQYKLFAAGNLSVFALKKFVETHKCNRYCRMLDLKVITYEEKQEIFNHYLNHLNCLVKCRLNSKFGDYFAQ